MSYMKRTSKKIPLKEKPLRNPGESIQDEIDRVFNEVIIPRYIAIVIFFILAILEWIRYFLPSSPSPIIFSVIAVGYSVYALSRNKSEMFYCRLLKKGLDGEKFVGQYLDGLRSQNCQVFHDVNCGNFNIDHVIVAPQGIFVIETKNFSKPMRGSPIVEFDGKEVVVDKMKPSRNPVEQVCALKNWLSNFLFEITGHKYTPRGVVIFSRLVCCEDWKTGQRRCGSA